MNDKKYVLIPPLIIFVLLMYILLLPNSTCYALSAKVRYDIYFRIYTKRFFGYSVHWYWFKAQGMAESNLDPNAVSPVGAIGIMQLMPFTSKEVAKQLGIKNMPRDPELNIMMGIYYDYKMFKIWKKCKVLIERLRFMFASYNAGPGHIIKANRKAPKAIKYKWDAIVRYLPTVTGKHSVETISYVRRIERYYMNMKRTDTSEGTQVLSIVFTITSVIKKWINKLFQKA